MSEKACSTAEPKDAIPAGAPNNYGGFQTFYLKGWRLQLLNIAMCISFFLATIESTIVSTALLPITNSLEGFSKASWVVTAYLLTSSSFLIVIAKLSDTFGRKTMMAFSLVVFMAFSIGCGLAQTMFQLIILRALQGVGASGITTLVFIILPECISPSEYPIYAAILSSMLALASLLGPILGGVICERASWRWVFLFNTPPACIAVILVLITVPSKSKSGIGWSQKLQEVDYLGALLTLGASALFVTALEQAAAGFSWLDAMVLPLLITSIFLLAACLFWARYRYRQNRPPEPMLAWDLIATRYSAGLFLNSFFTGAVFLSAVFCLPQQFQVVFQDSAAKAGYRLLSMTLTSPIFSGVAGFLTQKRGCPPLYILLASQSLSMLGSGLLSTIPRDARSYPHQEYIYQVIIGAAFGLGISTTVMAAPLAFSQKNLAVGMGMTNQMRSLGMTIGVAACANILLSTLSFNLKGQLSAAQFSALLGSAKAVQQIPGNLQEEVRKAFFESFRFQMQAACGFAASGFVGTLLMAERRPRFQQNVPRTNNDERVETTR